MAGWIKISREISSHWIWEDPVKLKWWLDILMTVNFEDKKTAIGFKLLQCKRGESLMSLQSWAKRWGVSKTVVNSFFKLLENDNMIETVNETITTRLIVCNYDSYQQLENANETQQKRNENATKTQQSTTKEGKEGKERKEVLLVKSQNDFYQSLTKYIDDYSPETLREFYEYWSEPNKSRTKIRWQLEKTWDTKKRLDRWVKNNFNKNDNPKQKTYKPKITTNWD